MRNAIFAVALFVCVPAWAQTALPPQWGTSGNAAPTPKGKAGETKKPVKVKPGTGSLRVIVIDRNSGRMGSVTIPAAALSNSQ